MDFIKLFNILPLKKSIIEELKLRKKSIFPIIIGTFIFTALSTSNLIAQCSMMKGHGNHSGHSEHGKQSTDGGDTTLIRKGAIEVDELDFDICEMLIRETQRSGGQ